MGRPFCWAMFVGRAFMTKQTETSLRRVHCSCAASKRRDASAPSRPQYLRRQSKTIEPPRLPHGKIAVEMPTSDEARLPLMKWVECRVSNTDRLAGDLWKSDKRHSLFRRISLPTFCLIG